LLTCNLLRSEFSELFAVFKLAPLPDTQSPNQHDISTA
jgi:hypothetical protein